MVKKKTSKSATKKTHKRVFPAKDTKTGLKSEDETQIKTNDDLTPQEPLPSVTLNSPSSPTPESLDQPPINQREDSQNILVGQSTVDASKPQPTSRFDVTTPSTDIKESPAIDTLPSIKKESESEIIEEVSVEKSSKKLWILVTLVLGLLAGAAGVFIFYWVTQKKEPIKEKPVTTTLVTASVTPTVSQTTPTPTPSFDRSKWTFEVLNGSGVAGIAKKTADKLALAGFVVVLIDNADKNTYSKSELYLTEKLIDQSKMLLSELKNIITIASVSGSFKESTAAARLIVGKDQ